MTEPDLQKIMEKVRRLLALANSENVHEAAAAAAKAQEIMFKYNLSQNDIPKNQREDYVKENYTVGKGREVSWARELLHSVAKYNFCKSLYTHDVDSRGRLHRVPYMVVVGERHNIELVKYIHEYCRQEIHRLADKIWLTEGFGHKTSWKKDFCYGAVQGVSEKLREQWLADKQATVKTTALIVVKDKELSEAVNRLIGRTRPMNLGGSAGGAGYARGVEAGRNIQINKAVGNTSNVGGYIR